MDELPNDGRLVALLTYPSSFFVRQRAELVPSASDRDQSERDGHKSSNGKHHPHGGLLPGIVYRGWVNFLQSVRRGDWLRASARPSCKRTGRPCANLSCSAPRRISVPCPAAKA